MHPLGLGNGLIFIHSGNDPSDRRCKGQGVGEELSPNLKRFPIGSSPGQYLAAIEQAGVEALAVRADGWDGQCPMNARGVRLKDGRVLPSWDWVTTPRVVR